MLDPIAQELLFFIKRQHCVYTMKFFIAACAAAIVAEQRAMAQTESTLDEVLIKDIMPDSSRYVEACLFVLLDYFNNE